MKGISSWQIGRCLLYIQKKVNDGGSGGFYAAMKEAFNRGYDWLWLMDDDGLPDRKELKELYNKSVEYHLQYANALVLDIKDPTHFLFWIIERKACLYSRGCEEETCYRRCR